MNIVTHLMVCFSSMVSSVLYELYTPSGAQVLPAHVNFRAPTETALAGLIDFTSVNGATYELETSVRATLSLASHNSSSSSTLMRRSECMQFVVKGTFVQENLAAFKTVLETSVTSVSDITISNIVMASFEEVIVEGLVYMLIGQRKSYI